jgi:hypothetical protein
MKKINLILACLMAFVFIATKTQAQTASTNPFAGKWDVLAKGIPGGDKHIFFTITEADGKLGGTMTDPESKAETPLTKVDKDDKGIVLYFSAQGYDISLTLQKKDDDHVAGSMMAMFECTGERVKQ